MVEGGGNVFLETIKQGLWKNMIPVPVDEYFLNQDQNCQEVCKCMH